MVYVIDNICNLFFYFIKGHLHKPKQVVQSLVSFVVYIHLFNIFYAMFNFSAFSSHGTSEVAASSTNDAGNDIAAYGVVNKAKKKKRGASRGK